MMRGRNARRWLMAAIVGELLAAGLVGALAWAWTPEEFAEAGTQPSLPAQRQDALVDDALPPLAAATEAAKKPLHRPLFDRPPAPTIVKAEPPRVPKKSRPAVKLIGTIADPSGNRGIFETTPQHTEVRKAGERFEQLPTVQVKEIRLDKAVLQVDSEEFEVAIAIPASEGKAP